MNINHDANTYPGQEARIVHVSTTGSGRKLYALKTCATRPAATAWDAPDALRRYAGGKLLDLLSERN